MASTLTKTYYCAIRGHVRRLDSLTLPWTTVDVPNLQVTLNDIKTDPLDSDKVFTVGSGNSIYVSSNAGALWSVPGGTYGSTFLQTNWHEVWPIDTANIIACGDSGFIAKSIDGGVTFNNITVFPTPSGLVEPGKSARAIHFPTVNLGVVGFEDKVFLTTDGGTTWTFCNGGIGLVSTVPAVIPIINGIHIDPTGQIIVVHGNTHIWRSTDGGVTFLIVYTYSPNGSGTHLTWFDNNTLWGTGNYGQITQSINGGASWGVLKTGFPISSEDKAAHFYTLQDGFFSSNLNLYSTSNAGVSGVYSDTIPPCNPGGGPDTDFPVIIGCTISAVWTFIAPICYELTSCTDQGIVVIISDDLSQYVGQVVNVPGLSGCWTVDIASSCLNSQLLPAGPIQVLPSCDECNQSTSCYELRDCTALTPVIVTNDDLSAYVGQIARICDIQTELVLIINQITPTPCLPGQTFGFVSEITGPTSGFFFEDVTQNIIAYSNPSAFPLVIGSALCFQVGFPYLVLGTGQDPGYSIQFFLGANPVTGTIPLGRLMSHNFLQFLITNATIDSDITVTINYFTSLGFSTTIRINGQTTETEATVTITPPFNGESSVTEALTGSCICYSIVDIGPCLNGEPLVNPISEYFPDCECCLPPAAVEPEPPFQQSVPEIDKGYYHIPDNPCDILNNEKFASAMYDVFKEKAYGMTSCCPKALNKLWIKKELTDLSIINPPNYVCP